MEDQFRPHYRVSEAAATLGLTDYLVRQAIREGQLDAFRIGRSLRIRPQSVERLLRGTKTSLSGVGSNARHCGSGDRAPPGARGSSLCSRGRRKATRSRCRARRGLPIGPAARASRNTGFRSLSSRSPPPYRGQGLGQCQAAHQSDLLSVRPTHRRAYRGAARPVRRVTGADRLAIARRRP